MTNDLHGMPLQKIPSPSNSAEQGKYKRISDAQKDFKDSAELAWAAWLGFYNR